MKKTLILVVTLLFLLGDTILAQDNDVKESTEPETTQQEPETDGSETDEVEIEGDWGHLTGQFVIEGDLPEIPNEMIIGDQCNPGNPVPDDKLIVDENGGLQNVFIMMYLKNVEDPIPVHPSYDAAKEIPVVIDNSNCRFAPHATLIRTGQSLIVTNSDVVGHNCHVKPFNNVAKNQMVIANGKVDAGVFELGESSPSPVACDLHPWMDAFLLIRDEPYMALSTVDGTFTLENIPAGTWEFQFWHAKTKWLKHAEIEGYEIGRRGEIEVTIKDGETLDLGTISIIAEEAFK